MLRGKQLKQARLYASIATLSEKGLAKDLENKLYEWLEIIHRLGISKDSVCPAGGKYYYFESPMYLDLPTNLEALAFLVMKLQHGVQLRMEE